MPGTVAELLTSFTAATPDRLEGEYHRLVGALWTEGLWHGGLTPQAVDGASAIVAALDQLDDSQLGYAAVLLGLLIEAEGLEPGPVHAAVRPAIDTLLNAVRRGGNGQPVTLASLYLLAHFPGDRERILAAVSDLGLDAGDLTRLERGLQTLDPADPDLGRVWPAPAVWALNDDERDFDQSWIKEMGPEKILLNWDNDTRTVLGYAGAKAYWAVRNGKPAPEVPDPVAPPAEVPTEAVPGQRFGQHSAALRCPTCRGVLDFEESSVRCDACATTYTIGGGILDLSAGVRDGVITDDATEDLLQKLSEMPSMGVYYETVLRPAYLRLSGCNWGDAVTPALEHAYIADHINPVDGPVLDMACGAGRWTETVAKTVGAHRLIALDMGLPMLNTLRRRLPEIPAVMASALNLPFDDASLGAINIWNALQAFPDDAATAVAEIGRCLRPGGTLTMMTFRWETDPIGRYFQSRQYFPSRAEGHLLFELDELKAWLDEAGLAVIDESGPETFVFITAERKS